MPDEASDILLRALQFVHGHTSGQLRFGEHVEDMRYVWSRDGRIVLPVMVAMLEALDTVLFVPAWGDDSMEVQLTMDAFEERGSGGALADRWRMYHGEPPDVKWASCQIDSARFEGHVIDGDGLMVANALAEAEGRLCKWVNTAHRDDLKRVCARFGTMAVEEPVMVGIDAWGIDVRAMFDVARVPFDMPVRDEHAARSTLERMMREAM